MFGKLLKHELRSSRKILGILSAAFCGVGMIGCLLAWFIRYSIRSLVSDIDPSPLIPMGMTFAFFAVYGILFIAIAYTTAVQIILLVNFYKSRFTDRGYLTFTLPATPRQLYWSGVLNMMIWSALSSLVILLVYGSMLTVGLYGVPIRQLFSEPDIQMVLQTWGQMIAPNPWILVVFVLMLAVSGLYNIMFPLACVIIASTLVKRMRLLLAFGLQYGISQVFGFISALSGMIPTLVAITASGSSVTGSMNAVSVTYSITLLLTAGLTVVSYILSVRCMKRVNLP